MEQAGNLSNELCADDVVCFIADRHPVTPQRLLRDFLNGKTSLSLEPNEVEILKGLSGPAANNGTTNSKRR